MGSFLIIIGCEASSTIAPYPHHHFVFKGLPTCSFLTAVTSPACPSMGFAWRVGWCSFWWWHVMTSGPGLPSVRGAVKTTRRRPCRNTNGISMITQS